MQKTPSIAGDASYSHKYIQPQLLRAVESDDVTLLRDIITKARDNGQLDDNILSVALMRSCQKGKRRASECLLQLGAKSDGTTDTARTRLSPLLRAVDKNHISVVLLLLAYGAMPDAQDKRGRTALMRAALANHYHVLDLLLKRGADPNRKDNEGRNVLHILAIEQHPGDYEANLVARLLEIRNIAIDGRDELKRTPLHWACSTGKLHLVAMFLSRKTTQANVNAVENRGKTSLHLAAAHDRVDIAEMLLKYGAALNMKSDGGWAPLHVACGIGSVKTVDLLLDCGAEVNAKLVNGMSPLHLAAQGGHTAVVKSLLQQQHIRKTARDTFGRTPFLAAAQSRRTDVMDLLAPWNDAQGLSTDTLGACTSFNAAIVDFGNFHNENRVQKKTIYELLYTRKPTIIQDRQATFRWIHLPANNMAWVDALFKKLVIEDCNFDVEAFGFLERSLSQQYGEQRPHSQHKAALCQSFLRGNSRNEFSKDEIMVSEQESTPPIGILSSKGEEPTSKGRQSPIVGTDPRPRPQANPGTTGSPNIRGPREIMLDRQTREKKRLEGAEREELERVHAKGQASLGVLRHEFGLQRKSNYPHDIKHRQRPPSGSAEWIIFTSMPYLHFETQCHVHEMQKAIKHAKTPQSLSLPLTKPPSVDEMLIHAYLTTLPPSLLVRRLLDPSIYQKIDIQSRDNTQVAENCRSENSPEHTDIDNKVLMVDQLWMWVLGENLIVTAFPQRWRQPRNDPSNVLESIITHINNHSYTRKEPIRSVYDLSMVISTHCSGALSRNGIHDQEFHFIDKFESFIYSATDQEIQLSENSKAISAQAYAWLRYHEGGKRLSKFGGQDSFNNNRKVKEESEIDRFRPGPFYANKLLDTRQESDLLTEIKNIRHEMSNIINVLKDQLAVLLELEKETTLTSSGSGTEQQQIERGFRDQAETIKMHIEQLGGIDAEACRIRNSLTDILELKEKHANAFEVRFARDQAAESARRTRNVTLFAILFSPLSFVTMFLIRDNMEYLANLLKGGHFLLSRDGINKYLLGIGLAILVVPSTITLSHLILKMWRNGTRRWKNWRQGGETRESENVGSGLGLPRIRPISIAESDDVNFAKQIESIPPTPTSSVLIANKKPSMGQRISFDQGDEAPLAEDDFGVDYDEQFGTGVERDMMVRSNLDAEIDTSNKRRTSGASPRSDEPPNYSETTADETGLTNQAYTEVTQDDLLSTQSSVLSPDSTPLQSISRLSWTCRCGHESYDDFTQLTPTGLQEMINELQSSGFITKATVTTRTPSKTEIIFSRLSTLGRYIGSLISRRPIKQGLPVSETHTETMISHLHPPRPDCKFLHVCVEKGRFSTRLHHIDVCDKKTDRAIFQTLRKDYKELRRELNSMLYKIRRIDFVEFQVYPKSLVDSIIPDQLPPPPPQNVDYEYFPVPPSTKPPIGSKFMMHMWHCKEEVPEKDFFSKRFPKKMREPCQFTWDDSHTANLGWGLHIVESLNVTLLVWIAFTFTAVAGLVFGISWTIMKDDVSGAYTVASYITALMTLLLMAVMSVITGI